MKKARYLVAGCGQVGAGLARDLSVQGHEVVVLDPDPVELARLGPGFGGERVADSPLDRDVLLRAGIERCDGLAAVFHQEATNVALALAARRLFRVPRVVARLEQPRLAETCHRLGVLTLCPQRWGVNRLVQLLRSSPFEVLASLGSQLDLVEVALPAALVGRCAEDLAVPQDLQVVLIIRAGRSLLVEPKTPFQEGDVLQILVRGTALDHLRNLLSWEAS